MTPATDVYSLGIVMYELLTAEVPFPGDNFVAIAMQHLNEPVPNILERRLTNQAEQYPGISIAVVPTNRPCGGNELRSQNSDVKIETAGPWAHVDPPRTLPAWRPRPGFATTRSPTRWC